MSDVCDGAIGCWVSGFGEGWCSCFLESFAGIHDQYWKVCLDLRIFSPSVLKEFHFDSSVRGKLLVHVRRQGGRDPLSFRRLFTTVLHLSGRTIFALDL